MESISRLSLKQRELLIDKLNQMGAQVRNPHIYDSDLDAERRLSNPKEPQKILVFSQPKESQLRTLDALANQIHWRELDGYLRFWPPHSQMPVYPQPHSSPLPPF